MTTKQPFKIIDHVWIKGNYNSSIIIEYKGYKFLYHTKNFSYVEKNNCLYLIDENLTCNYKSCCVIDLDNLEDYDQVDYYIYYPLNSKITDKGKMYIIPDEYSIMFQGEECIDEIISMANEEFIDYCNF